VGVVDVRRQAGVAQQQHHVELRALARQADAHRRAKAAAAKHHDALRRLDGAEGGAGLLAAEEL
jgi:hypothetical protein